MLNNIIRSTTNVILVNSRILYTRVMLVDRLSGVQTYCRAHEEHHIELTISYSAFEPSRFNSSDSSCQTKSYQ